LEEIFLHSFAVDTTLNDQAIADSVKTEWEASWSSVAAPLSNVFSSEITYNEVISATIMVPTLPKPKLSIGWHSAWTPALVGTAGVAMIPSQAAISISLSGGQRDTGAPYKGRFYLPTPSVNSMKVDGTLTDIDQQLINQEVGSFLARIKIAGIVPCIWSRKVGVVVPANLMRVGNKIDTIRRRRNKLPETYLQTSL
jgi:hypothetical protein